MKETKRKAFKFYRSYYDMFNMLKNDAERLKFIQAVLEKQFLGSNPEPSDSNWYFAYMSQLHSIDKQVKGWQDATGQELTGAYDHPPKGPLVHPLQEEQVKEEVKEKVKEKEEEKVKVKKEPIPHWNENLPTGLENRQ